MTDRVSSLLNILFAFAFISAIAWIIAPSALDYYYQNDQIIAIADEFNRSASKYSNNDYKLTNAEAGRGKSIIYNYTLVNHNAADVDPYALKSETKPHLIEEVKLNSSYNELRAMDANMVFVYHSNDEIEVARIEITPTDYSS